MKTESFPSLANLRRVSTVVASALLAACAAGPDYVRPDLATPERYVAKLPESEAGRATATPEARDVQAQQLSESMDIPAQWWELFHSEPLNAWVKDSLAHNPNVEAAQAALRVAHENAQAEAGAFWPNVALNYSPIRQQVAEAVASPVSNNSTLYTLHTAQVTVTYAPDIFGGTRRAVEAASAQTEQQRFQLEASYLTLSSNVVVAAITEASLRAQRAATLAVIASQQQVLQKFVRQQQLGQVAMADVDAQRATLATTEATLPPLDKQLAVQRNQLLALAGRYPANDVDAHFDLETLELPGELPLALPSTLVEHRPDVRAAEAQMHAASAAIGVAVAARLPNVQLGVNAYGSSAFTLSQLFTSSSVFWTLAASVTQPVIDGGALKHREAAGARRFRPERGPVPRDGARRVPGCGQRADRHRCGHPRAAGRDHRRTRDLEESCARARAASSRRCECAFRSAGGAGLAAGRAQPRAGTRGAVGRHRGPLCRTGGRLVEPAGRGRRYRRDELKDPANFFWTLKDEHHPT